ncbi:Uncharacterised protein [Candidatus Tiddalikarchaeum anstoanum]|nr:Uncharacterised protein [Candidatus Tiddalikarchaeum anstoanum]
MNLKDKICIPLTEILKRAVVYTENEDFYTNHKGGLLWRCHNKNAKKELKFTAQELNLQLDSKYNIKPESLLDYEIIKKHEFYGKFSKEILTILAQQYDIHLDDAGCGNCRYYMSDNLYNLLAKLKLAHKDESFDFITYHLDIENKNVSHPNFEPVVNMLRELPVRKDLMSIINSYIFKTIKEYVLKTGVVYKGMSAYDNKTGVDYFKKDIAEKGFSENPKHELICLSGDEEVSSQFSSNILELDPSKLELVPCKYNNHESAFIFHRTELEIRTPKITKESIIKIKHIQKNILKS